MYKEHDDVRFQEAVQDAIAKLQKDKAAKTPADKKEIRERCKTEVKEK